MPTRNLEAAWVYEPDEPVAPGATIHQWLDRLDLTQADLAPSGSFHQTRQPTCRKRNGHLKSTNSVEQLLEKVLGVSDATLEPTRS